MEKQVALISQGWMVSPIHSAVRGYNTSNGVYEVRQNYIKELRQYFDEKYLERFAKICYRYPQKSIYEEFMNGLNKFSLSEKAIALGKYYGYLWGIMPFKH